MANPFFRFKQFTVYHDLCAMKVGADGVTLGAWADVSATQRILDVGCGSGLIALMLAQRTDALITAIDIDEQSIIQTNANVKNSPWKDKVDVIHTSFQQFASNDLATFDLIVSNPPYFSNSLKSDDSLRTLARHNDSLSLEDLVLSAKLLLSANGKLALILPLAEGGEIVEIAAKNELWCSKKTVLKPLSDKNPKRVLLEFQLHKVTCEMGELIVESERGTYSPAYEKMVKDFYLKLAD